MKRNQVMSFYLRNFLEGCLYTFAQVGLPGTLYNTGLYIVCSTGVCLLEKANDERLIDLHPIK